jgi:hypothetical protein
MKSIIGITQRLMLVFLALVASSMMFFSSPAVAATDTEAYFAFEYPPSSETFTIKLTDPDKIQQARDILSGKQQDRTHVMGKIIKSKAPYNSNWDFQLDPSSIQFFAFAIEVCDASTRYVEDHLDEAGGAFLPGGFWCPWNSRLVKEVSSQT